MKKATLIQAITLFLSSCPLFADSLTLNCQATPGNGHVAAEHLRVYLPEDGRNVLSLGRNIRTDDGRILFEAGDYAVSREPKYENEYFYGLPDAYFSFRFSQGRDGSPWPGVIDGAARVVGGEVRVYFEQHLVCRKKIQEQQKVSQVYFQFYHKDPDHSPVDDRMIKQSGPCAVSGLRIDQTQTECNPDDCYLRDYLVNKISCSGPDALVFDSQSDGLVRGHYEPIPDEEALSRGFRTLSNYLIAPEGSVRYPLVAKGLDIYGLIRHGKGQVCTEDFELTYCPGCIKPHEYRFCFTVFP